MVTARVRINRKTETIDRTNIQFTRFDFRQKGRVVIYQLNLSQKGICSIVSQFKARLTVPYKKMQFYQHATQDNDVPMTMFSTNITATWRRLYAVYVCLNNMHISSSNTTLLLIVYPVPTVL